jgi:hypothetical protein
MFMRNKGYKEYGLLRTAIANMEKGNYCFNDVLDGSSINRESMLPHSPTGEETLCLLENIAIGK